MNLGLQTVHRLRRVMLCWTICQWTRLQFNNDTFFSQQRCEQRGVWRARLEAAGGFLCRGDSTGGRQAAFALALRFEAFNSWALRQRPLQLRLRAGDAPASGFLTLLPLMCWWCICNHWWWAGRWLDMRVAAACIRNSHVVAIWAVCSAWAIFAFKLSLQVLLYWCLNLVVIGLWDTNYFCYFIECNLPLRELDLVCLRGAPGV